MTIKKIIKNFSYTISSNLISLLISTLVILIVPKLIGISAYGYWQLYIFYTTYVGMLHLGWVDGIYLKYGGKKYSELDQQSFFSQFVILLAMQIVFGCFFAVWSYTTLDSNQSFIILATGICTIAVNMRQFFLVIMQDTNRIKDYSKVTILDRGLYIFIVLTLLVIGVRDYRLLIMGDLIGKYISFFVAMYSCKELSIHPISFLKVSFSEIWDNVNIGIKLLLANFASILIIGIVRFGIEKKWGVTVFGKVSLTLNISNLLMVFINAISIVLFPILRRTKKEKLSDIYIYTREILILVLFIGMLIYYPLDIILPAWLPKYKTGLVYMALLFPMCIYEGKFALLISTYMKTLRLEKSLLGINIISLILSAIVTSVNIFMIQNLNLIMFSIVIILGFRSTISEVYLSKKIGVSIVNEILLETIMIASFILSSWFLPIYASFSIYVVSIAIYIFIKRNIVKKGIILIKKGV